MSKTVPLVHPAPLLCLHRTPGQARVDFVQITTPVRPRAEALSAFEPIPPLGSPCSRQAAYVHDGGIWIRERCGADEFVREMGTPSVGLRGYERLPSQALVRTPLHALWPDGPARGEPLGIRKVRTVVRDYADRARAEAIAYLDRNVRLVEGHVFRRCPGPLALHASTSVTPTFRIDLGTFRFQKGNGMLESHHVVAPRADRAAEFWEFEKAFYMERHPGKLRDSYRDAPMRLDPGGFGAHLALGDPYVDLLAFACDAPGVLLRNLSPRDLAVPEVRAAAEPLHHWMALGEIGAVDASEAEAATLAACGLVEALAAHRPDAPPHTGMAKLAAYGRHVALPRLRGAFEALPEEDAAALASFGA